MGNETIVIACPNGKLGNTIDEQFESIKKVMQQFEEELGVRAKLVPETSGQIILTNPTTGKECLIQVGIMDEKGTTVLID